MVILSIQEKRNGEMFKKEMTTSCVYTSSSGNISLTKKIFSSQKSPCFPDKTNTLFENVITFERVKKYTIFY